ncbi:hypothetical protein CBS147353_11185 [Aspergillus niger]|nr:hypothetical protein CBS147353_11185 [Aspergillus niger]
MSKWECRCGLLEKPKTSLTAPIGRFLSVVTQTGSQRERAPLRNIERDTVDNLVEKVIEALRDDERLQREFGIQGRVIFYDRTNPSETSLENSSEQMILEDARTP